MATLKKAELVSALARLGELAVGAGVNIDLLLLGGGAMVLGFNARAATRDVDVVILAPADRVIVRRLSESVANERGWPADWLNEGAKGFVVGTSKTVDLISCPGLTVRMPSLEQLLAMKLCAWRDDVDIGDARRLLSEARGPRDVVWNLVAAYLQPGRELKAKYAFDDLWENLHGTD